eukprot:5816006-Karenia_brevis.AAC.1
MPIRPRSHPSPTPSPSRGVVKNIFTIFLDIRVRESGSAEMRMYSFLPEVISFNTAISACVEVGGGSACRQRGARRAVGST